MIIYLYKKTHNITKLCYLGKTIKNPYLYRGSGKDWKEHLLKNGNNVITEIIKECNTHEELNYWGRYYSKLWNIVNAMDDFGNKIWANKIPETGGGDGSYWDDPEKAAKAKIKISQTMINKKIGRAFNQHGQNNHMYGKVGPAHHAYGEKRDSATRKLISENHHDVRGAKNPKARKIIIVTPNGEKYESHGTLQFICEKLGIPVNTIYTMLSKNKTQFVRGKFKGYKVFYADK